MAPRLKHFAPHEFQCHCGNCGLGINEMSVPLLSRLDLARELIARPITINSPVRCPSHNAAVGGTPKSSHLLDLRGTAHAVDLAAPTSRDRWWLVTGLTLAELVHVGALSRDQAAWAAHALAERGRATRLGLGQSLVHVDDDPHKEPGLIWVYRNK